MLPDPGNVYFVVLSILTLFITPLGHSVLLLLLNGVIVPLRTWGKGERESERERETTEAAALPILPLDVPPSLQLWSHSRPVPFPCSLKGWLLLFS